MTQRHHSHLETYNFAVAATFSLVAALVAFPAGASSEFESSSSSLSGSASDRITPAQEVKPAVAIAPERTLSLRACFDRANDSNKEIITAKYNLPVLRSGIQIAGAIPNPHFNLLYGFGPAFRIIIAGNPQQFGFQEEFLTAGKRSKRMQLARANYKVAELQVAALLFDVHNRVRRAYAELAAAEAYANLVESERKVASELLNTASRRFDSGKAPKSEVLLAQLGVLQFDTQRNQAQARLQQSSAALGLILGEVPQQVEIIDVDDNGIFKLSADKTDLVPPPSHNLPPLNELLPLAYQQRPDLKTAVQQAFADRKALTLAKASRIPDITVDTGYQFTTFLKNQPFALDNGTTPNSPGAYLNIGAETPIFYQHQGEIAQAKETWLQDFDQIDQLEWRIATDIVTSYESVAVARANIFKFQKEVVPAAAQVAKQARRRYEVGKSDLASAIVAKQQYQQTLSSYFDAVVAYQNAWADLEKAVGVPLQL